MGCDQIKKANLLIQVLIEEIYVKGIMCSLRYINKSTCEGLHPIIPLPY